MLCGVTIASLEKKNQKTQMIKILDILFPCAKINMGHTVTPCGQFVLLQHAKGKPWGI